MIQAEPIYVVVTGEKQNRRAYFASRFQNQAQAFASAFAHDPARPRVEEYQTITMGADFYVGAKAFNVTMGRDDGVVGVDTKPGMWDFGYMNQSTDDSPDVIFHVWARNEAEAVATATKMRDQKVREGAWPPMKVRWRVHSPADLPKKPRSEEFAVAIYGPRDPLVSLALSAHYGVDVDGFKAEAGTPGVRAMEDVLKGLKSDGLALLALGPGHVIPIVTISSSGPPPTPPVPAAFGIAFWVEEEATR